MNTAARPLARSLVDRPAGRCVLQATTRAQIRQRALMNLAAALQPPSSSPLLPLVERRRAVGGVARISVRVSLRVQKTLATKAAYKQQTLVRARFPLARSLASVAADYAHARARLLARYGFRQPQPLVQVAAATAAAAAAAVATATKVHASRRSSASLDCNSRPRAQPPSAASKYHLANRRRSPLTEFS